MKFKSIIEFATLWLLLHMNRHAHCSSSIFTDIRNFEIGTGKQLTHIFKNILKVLFCLKSKLRTFILLLELIITILHYLINSFKIIHVSKSFKVLKSQPTLGQRRESEEVWSQIMHILWKTFTVTRNRCMFNHILREIFFIPFIVIAFVFSHSLFLIFRMVISFGMEGNWIILDHILRIKGCHAKNHKHR